MDKIISEEENKEIKILNQKISKLLEKIKQSRLLKKNKYDCKLTCSEINDNKELEKMFKRKNKLLGIKTVEDVNEEKLIN